MERNLAVAADADLGAELEIFKVDELDVGDGARVLELVLVVEERVVLAVNGALENLVLDDLLGVLKEDVVKEGRVGARVDEDDEADEAE